MWDSFILGVCGEGGREGYWYCPGIGDLFFSSRFGRGEEECLSWGYCLGGERWREL